MKVNEHYFQLKDSYLFATVGKKTAEYKKAHPDKDVIRLSIGDVTRPLAPAVIEAMHRAVDDMSRKESFHGYGPDQTCYGYDALIESIKGSYLRKGVSLETEEVFISDGAKSDLGNILELFADDTVALIPDPVYPAYVDANVMSGRKVVYSDANEGNGFLPMPDESVHADLIYLCSPNNPTGALMSAQMLKDICEIARSVGAWVLCDEVYRGLTQEAVYSPSVADLYEKGISTASMSKVFSMAGLRFGWIAAPREIIEAVLHHRDYNTISVGMLDEYFTELALTAKDKILERNRAIIRENLEILDKWVQSEPRASYVKPKAGTTAFVKIDTKLTSHEFCERLVKEKGVMFTPGSALHTEGYVRIGYANNKDVLQKGLALTSEFLKEID